MQIVLKKLLILFYRLDGCVVLKSDEEVLRSTWLEMTRNKAANEAKVSKIEL